MSIEALAMPVIVPTLAMANVRDIIALLVAPVVMMSAGGMLSLAMFNRFTAVVSRTRAFLKERYEAVHRLSLLELERQTSEEARIIRRRLTVLDLVTASIVRRARLLRAAVMCMLTAVLCLLGCSLSLGLSMLAPVEHLVLGLFIAAVLSMIVGVCLAMLELRRALDPLVLEQEAITGISATREEVRSDALRQG